MATLSELQAQQAALAGLKTSFNTTASTSDSAATVFNAVPLAARLPEVQTIVPAYNQVVTALQNTGQKILFGISTVNAALLSLGIPPPDGLPAPVGTVPFDAVAEFPTPEQISIYAPLKRMVAASTQVSTQYRLQGASQWRLASPMTRADIAATSYSVSETDQAEYFGVCIFDLAPGSTYEILLTCTEPGPAVTSVAFTAVTRALPAVAGTPNKFATPSDDLNTIFKALVPGDVLQLANGHYTRADGGSHFSDYDAVKGTATNPIYIRGESRDGVMIHASGTQSRTIALREVDHIVFENMSITCEKQQGATSSWRCVELQDNWTQKNITFREIHFTGPVVIGCGFAEHTGFLFYNNICTGTQGAWETTVATNQGWGANLVQLCGTGHCIFNNDITGFGDSVKHKEGLFTASNFFYRNKVRDCLDDLVEFDYTIRNCAVYDNHVVNTATALSMDYTGGGPYYYFRNQVVNTTRGPYKFNSNASGYHVWNNTIVRKYGFTPSGMYISGSTAQRSYCFQNNVFVDQGNHEKVLELDNMHHDPVDFDHNAWFPNGKFEFEDSTTYTDLADYAARSRTTTPVHTNNTKRLVDDIALVADPFTKNVVLTDSLVPCQMDWQLTLKSGSNALSSGRVIPNITDGFTGSAPDRGASIAGVVRSVGYGGLPPVIIPDTPPVVSGPSPLADYYTSLSGNPIYAGKLAPITVQPAQGDIPEIFMQTFDLSKVLHFRSWHDSGRYERSQNLAFYKPTSSSSTAQIEFRFTDFHAGGNLIFLQGTTYTMLVDGVPSATCTVTPNTVHTAAFTSPIGLIASGWREIDIISDHPGEICPKWFMCILRPGDPQPTMMPVCRGSYDLGRFDRPYAWAWVKREFAPTPMPLELRTFPDVAYVPNDPNLFLEDIATTNEGLSHRPNVNSDGVWNTFNMQTYYWQDVYRKHPRVPLLDGPRGVGTVVFPTHIQVDRHGGAYMCDPWRVVRVDQYGKVSTRCGYRHTGVASHWDENETKQPTLELVGDWSAIPIERRGFHEIWGMAFDLDSLSLNEAGQTQVNGFDGAIEKPHQVGPRQFIADSQNNRICLLTYQKDSFDAVPKVTEFITGLADAWDCVWDNGFLYVSERHADRINKYNAVTGALVEVLIQRNPALPGTAIGTSDRGHDVTGTLEERRAQPCLAPEGLFIQDGWLFFASITQGDIRRINLTTKELQIIGNFEMTGNTSFAKFSVSDGTFYPRGTTFISSWATNYEGVPQAIMLDGTNHRPHFYAQVPRGGGNASKSIGYSAAVGVGNGRLYYGASDEGLHRLSKLLPGDITYDDQKSDRGFKAFLDKGYDILYSQRGYGYQGYPLPWNKSVDINYWLEACGHTPPPLPAWREGQAINEWREILGSSMAASPPSIDPGRSSEGLQAILDNWAGLSIDTRSSRIWSAANGGGNDTHENGVRYLDLMLPSPKWVETLPSNTASEFTIPNNAARYSSGRPASARGYYSQVFIEARNRAMRFGSLGVATSGASFPAIEGFNCDAPVGTNGWDAVNTWATYPGTATPGQVTCKVSNEDVIVIESNVAVHKWTQATNTWSVLPTGAPPQDFTGAASAYDSKSNRILILKENFQYMLTLTDNTFAQVALNGPAKDIICTGISAQGLTYSRETHSHYVRRGAAGNEVYIIEPSYWGTNTLGGATSIPITGGTAIPAPRLFDSAVSNQHVYRRFLYCPILKGIVYIPSYSSNAWFLRII